MAIPVGNAKTDRYKYGALLIVALVGAALLEAKILPGCATTVVVGILAFACAAETAAMAKAAGAEPLAKISVGMSAALILACALPRLEQSFSSSGSFSMLRRFTTAELGIFAFLFFTIACVLRQKTEGAVQTLGAGAVVILVTTSLLFLLDIRFLNGDASFDGLQCLLFLVAVSKVGDIAAYVVGSAVGKHKLIPAISPGKTWEGSAASLLAASGVAGIFGALHFSGPLTPERAVAAGIIINIASQFGDLAESLLKRSAGVKDSGKWLPQFGGAFDLADSLFLAGPVFYGFLRVASY